MTSPMHEAERFQKIVHPTALQAQVAEEIVAGPRGKVTGAFEVILHNPALASHLQKLGAYLRFETDMPADLRQLAILVAAAHWCSGYEWLAHAEIARRQALLPEAVIASLRPGQTPRGLTTDQAAVHSFCVAMHRDGKPTDAEFAAVNALLGTPGILDLVAVCGYYALLAMAMNAANFPLPEGATPPF